MKFKIRKNQIKYYLISSFVVGILSISAVYAVINTVEDGFRGVVGVEQTVDAHGECRKIINSGADEVFIPTRTDGEWQDFRDNKPSDVAINNCVWTCGNNIVDARDSKSYATVQIGTQCWLAENLNVGTRIDSCDGGSKNKCIDSGDTAQDQEDNGYIEKYCFWDEESNCEDDGGFYQWDEAMQYSEVESSQGICPTNWHIPTDVEYKTLIEGQATIGCEGELGWFCSPVATELNFGGSSGFNVLYPGERYSSGATWFLNQYTTFWSSSLSGSDPWVRALDSSVSAVSHGYWDDKKSGFSVRCIKDIAECGDTVFGGTETDFAYSVQQTADGGYILAGYTRSYGAGGNDMYLVKTDSLGDEIWSKTYGGEFNDRFFSVQQIADGGYIVAGYTMPTDANSDGYLARTDISGDIIWEQTFGDNNYIENVRSFQQTSDGGYILAGSIRYSGDVNDADMYLVKTDSTGNETWSETYDEGFYETAYSVQQTSDGGYFVIGHTGSYSTGADDIYLVKTDSVGNKIWSKTFGEISFGERAYSMQQTSDGGYIVAGEKLGVFIPPIHDGQVYLLKIDSDGNEIWDQSLGENDYDEFAYSVQQTADGGYIVAGITYSNYNAYLIKTDSLGNEIWKNNFGGDSPDRARAVQQTVDGGYIVAGETSSYDVGNYDMYLVKTDSMGNECCFSTEGNSCDVNLCQTGEIQDDCFCGGTIINKTAGTNCGTGKECDGSGNCVGCVGDADCGAGETCLLNTCLSWSDIECNYTSSACTNCYHVEVSDSDNYCDTSQRLTGLYWNTLNAFRSVCLDDYPAGNSGSYDLMYTSTRCAYYSEELRTPPTGNNYEYYNICRLCKCTLDSHCDDGNSCTDDVCNLGVCDNINNNSNTCLTCSSGVCECQNGNCVDTGCVAHDYTACAWTDIAHNYMDVYWYDSCDNKEDMADDCVGTFCSGHTCQAPTAPDLSGLTLVVDGDNRWKYNDTSVPITVSGITGDPTSCSWCGSEITCDGTQVYDVSYHSYPVRNTCEFIATNDYGTSEEIGASDSYCSGSDVWSRFIGFNDSYTDNSNIMTCPDTCFKTVCSGFDNKIKFTPEDCVGDGLAKEYYATCLDKWTADMRAGQVDSTCDSGWDSVEITEICD